jgi:hypothetical protein
LQSLSTKFLHTERTALESLNEVYSDISRLAAQCSVRFRDDQSKADFLKVAVERQVWALGAVEEYLSNPSSFMPNKFQGFHGRLTAALTARAASKDVDNPERSVFGTSLDADRAYPTHYGSQYGVRPPVSGKPSNVRRTSNTVRPNVPTRLSDSEWKLLSVEEKKSRRTCFKCGERGHYVGDAACRESETTMTDAIKARYRSSGGDRAAASTMLFEIAVSVDEQAREEHMESQVVVNNFYDHLLDEYESRSEPETTPSNSDENQLFVAPSVE